MTNLDLGTPEARPQTLVEAVKAFVEAVASTVSFARDERRPPQFSVHLLVRLDLCIQKARSRQT